MRVLAFDLGATFGWAMGFDQKGGLPDAVERYGQVNLPGERPERLRHFADHAARLIERRNPALVVYERPFARGEAATRSLWGMAGVLEATATKFRCAVFDACPPSTAKKFFTGSGNAGKNDMIAEAQKRLGMAVDPLVLGEHEADAIAILLYTLANRERT